MKLEAVTEIWILEEKGKALFHYPQSIPMEKSGLLKQFISGIMTFMKDMGGNEEYHVSMAQNRIIGLKMEEFSSTLANYYIVAAFVGRNSKRYIKELRALGREFSEILLNNPNFDEIRDLFIKKIHNYL